MKRLLALVLVLITLFSFSACAKKDVTADDAETAVVTEEAAEENAEAAEDETDKKAEENETEKNNADQSKEVYWATEGKDSSDVWYHTKDCDMIKDKSPDVLPWEIINTLGMTACEKCNP